MKKTNLLKMAALTSAILMTQISYGETVSVTDPQIVSSIQSQFSSDATTSGLHVDVSSLSGVVTLAGKVSTDVEADKLIQIAESTPGVSDVSADNLTVKTSKHKMSDTMITGKIKGMYVREKLFGDKDISLMNVSVETTNGIVYLTGAVDTQDEATNAVKYAEEIHGVKKVDSKLTVKATS